MQNSAPSSIEPYFFGEFRILGELGWGGMAVVYLAEHPAWPQQIALKVPRESSNRCMGRFRKEVRVASRLSHPGLARVLQAGSFEGTPYLAMEFVDGPTLCQEIADLRASGRARLLPQFRNKGLGHGGYHRAAARLVARLADTLDYVHTQGVVHRDLKPLNIIVRQRGSPCIIDFGLAMAMGGSSISGIGDIVGTLGYMSPEQILAKRVPIDRRTDVFTLGVILYELLTLSLPFEGELSEILSATCFRAPVPPSTRVAGTPREFDAICLRALQKDPQQRFDCAAEFAAALRRLLRMPERRGVFWWAH